MHPGACRAVTIDSYSTWCDDYKMAPNQRSRRMALALAISSVIVTPLLLFVEVASLVLTEVLAVPIALFALVLPFLAFIWTRGGSARAIAGVVLALWLVTQVWIGGAAAGLWSLF